MNQVWFWVRSLRKSPGLFLSVILLLGFGIGGNTAVFSVLHAVLLQPIPGVRRSAELVRIRRTQNGRVQGNASYPDYLDYRDQSKTLGGMVAERIITIRLSGPPAQLVSGGIVTGNYFQVMGAGAKLGRLLTPDDDRAPDAHPVAVLSESFWQRHFGADPGVMGRTLGLNGYPFTIVGVAAGPFDGVEFAEPAAIWIPMMMVRQAITRNSSYGWLSERRAGWLTYYGRLKAGVTPEAAEAELNTIARSLEERFPDSNHGRRIQVSARADMSPQQRAGLRSLLGMISVAVCVVLLIACGNVASLLLSRAAARSREMAIRLALGAGRMALLKQLLVESLLLGLAGGALGLLLAPWMASGLRTALHWQNLSRSDAGVLDVRVLAFALGVSLLAVFLFGLAPAWFAVRTDPGATLKSASPQGRSRGRLQRAWVVAQVALSVALVVGGSLVLRSMQRIVAIDPGYRPGRVVIATIDLSLLGYSPERGLQFFAELADRVSRLPGVQSVSQGKSSPAVDWSDRQAIFRQGEAPAAAPRYAELPGALLVDRNTIGTGYFRTLGIPLLKGRDFAITDKRGSQPVAIVSQALAERLWPGTDPIGKRITLPVDRQALPAPLEVIGVVADSRYRSVLEKPAPLLYAPVLQDYDSIARVMVAVNRNPVQFKDVLRRAIQEANPDLPVSAIDTMQDQIDRGLWRQRAAASLLTFFGVLALMLACAGIYGIVGYSVAQKTREIGIRMALGADRAYVLRRVVTQALGMTAIGIVLGLPLAFWARPALSTFLYDAGGLEPMAFAGVPLLFALVTVAASCIPARRAAAIDPAIALRQE